MCIEHLMAGDRDGYARVTFRGRTTGLHRLVLADKLGVDPDEVPVARHTCDNPRCIDPDHLIPGTVQDNVADRVSRSRTASGESNGNAVLNGAAIADIRANYRKHSREFGLRNFAEKYSCGISAVHAVVMGMTWAGRSSSAS